MRESREGHGLAAVTGQADPGHAEGAAQHHPLGLGQPILDTKKVAVTVMPGC